MSLSFFPRVRRLPCHGQPTFFLIHEGLFSEGRQLVVGRLLASHAA